jgi:ribonuclease Z
VSVAALQCDHGLPVLAFRLTERDIFTIDPDALAAAGLVPGPWLRELKGRWRRDALGQAPLTVSFTDGSEVREQTIADDAALFRRLRTKRPAASLGYVSDIGFTAANREQLQELLADTSLLCCECTFLAADAAKARASHHLCSSDVNQLAADLRPRVLLPMHLSKAYIHRPYDLYAELTPPAGTRVLRLPDYVSPRPRLLTELPPFSPEPAGDEKPYKEHADA